MSAPRQKSIENGKLQVLSPSLLNAFDSSAAFGCERRGWFKYVKGLPEPTTDAMTRGTHLHAMNEEYLKTGKILLGTPEQTAWFNAGRHYLDTLRARRDGYQGGSVVKGFWYATEEALPPDFRVYGVLVSPMSKCDVVTEAGIIDWKTTSDIEKYGKTPGQLAKDVQMLIYAKAFHPTAEAVTLTHGQYQTKGRVKFHASSVELTRNELDTNYERVINPLVEKVKAVAAVTDMNEVTPNRNACRTCPHSAVCPTEKASIIMSIFDRLKKSQLQAAAVSAPAEKTTFVAVDGSILPPDAPPSKPELAAKPVEGFSQKESGFEAVPPPRRNLIVNAPTSEPSPSADLATEAPKPTPPPAPEPEKKRGPGRPPGAKNKPKDNPIGPSDGEVREQKRKQAEISRAATKLAEMDLARRVVEADNAFVETIQFESVTVNYGLTLNLGNFNSVRFDVAMSAKGTNPDATYDAVMARVRAKVTEEIEKIQAEQKAAQTLNPAGK